MAGVNNFLQWNPGQSNQESDASYAADTQRVNGATAGAAFPSMTANKLFYQTSTGVAALMQMMATKGFNVVDTNLPVLASVLSAIQTSADIRGQLVTLPWAPVLNCDASKFNTFEVTLQGNTAINVTGQTPGQICSFHLVQDSTGSRTVTWPSNFFGVSGLQPDPASNHATIFVWEIGSDLTGRLTTPAMSINGIVSAPIGVNNPRTGNFTDAGVSGTLTTVTEHVTGNTQIDGSATVNGNIAGGSNLYINTGNINGNTIVQLTPPAQTENSTRVPTTNWAKSGLASSVYTTPTDITVAKSGYIQFPTWMGGWIINVGIVPMPGSSSSDNPTGFSFAKAFPNACFVVIPATFSPNADRITFIKSWTNSGGTMSNNGSLAAAAYIAIGY